jgi:hypothetical protein
MTTTALRLAPILAASLSFAAPALTAQKSQEELQAAFADMQTHAWYTGGGWTTDFDAAKARAKETGKPIFAYFTRTYAP